MKVNVPPSKSISNRVLVMGFLNQEEKVIRNVLKSDDTEVMLGVYDELKVSYEILSEDVRSFDIKVCGGAHVRHADLFMNNAGTATRFMLAALCVTSGEFTMTGNERMLKRPITDLVDALRQLGACIEYLHEEGFLPLKIKGGVLKGKCSIKGDVSSQFFSALIISEAFADANFEIDVIGDLVSKPYVDLTRKVVQDFKMEGEEYEVEGDASSASYWWGRAYLLDEKIDVTNVPMDTMQADIKFLEAIKKIPAEIDCVEFPDSAMTLAILCSVTKGESLLYGLANLKYKECDRLKALETEINKVGGSVQAFDDGLKITGIDPEDLHGAKIETYDDHRIAMCMALLQMLQPEIEILNPECVNKTYPTFWDEFL